LLYISPYLGACKCLYLRHCSQYTELTTVTDYRFRTSELTATYTSYDHSGLALGFARGLSPTPSLVPPSAVCSLAASLVQRRRVHHGFQASWAASCNGLPTKQNKLSVAPHQSGVHGSPRRWMALTTNHKGEQAVTNLMHSRRMVDPHHWTEDCVRHAIAR